MASNAKSVDERRRELMRERGLDAYQQTAEAWLSIAVAAERRGELHFAADCERAMEIANDIGAPTHD